MSNSLISPPANKVPQFPDIWSSYESPFFTYLSFVDCQIPWYLLQLGMSFLSHKSQWLWHFRLLLLCQWIQPARLWHYSCCYKNKTSLIEDVLTILNNKRQTALTFASLLFQISDPKIYIIMQKNICNFHINLCINIYFVNTKMY